MNIPTHESAKKTGGKPVHWLAALIHKEGVVITQKSVGKNQ
ncbi:MAG TPA: hypothetical protein VN456_07950 [Desulfosporosinus sp.]|nr:hypothetical protein [Desulfosporosinus sp.]